MPAAPVRTNLPSHAMAPARVAPMMLGARASSSGTQPPEQCHTVGMNHQRPPENLAEHAVRPVQGSSQLQHLRGGRRKGQLPHVQQVAEHIPPQSTPGASDLIEHPWLGGHHAFQGLVQQHKLVQSGYGYRPAAARARTNGISCRQDCAAPELPGIKLAWQQPMFTQGGTRSGLSSSTIPHWCAK